jgi:hydroxyethylthiazole kinase-like sugar kinase family protein
MLSAGLAVEKGNGAIAVNPKLLSDDGQIVVLRNKEGTVFDILTGGGCLSGAVPALTMHKNREVADALGKS